MKLKVVNHKTEEDGYWTEVPSIVGCATQSNTFEELLEKIAVLEGICELLMNLNNCKDQRCFTAPYVSSLLIMNTT